MTTSTSRRSSPLSALNALFVGGGRPSAAGLVVSALLAGLSGLFLCTLLLASTACAQDVAVLPIVKKVTFEGNELFSDEELSLRIRTRPNRRFLGIPGVTWWLWLYRLGESGSLGRRVGGALMSGGEPPAYIDQSVLSADADRLRLLYRQEGFREAEVSAVVDTLNARSVAITFFIDPGTATYIQRVSYEGVEHLSADQKYRMIRSTLLKPVSVNREVPLSFITQGQRYSEPTLLEERRRLLTFLRDEGYASVARDSIRALVFPQSRDSFDITFRIRTGPRFRFGDVQFVATGPEAHSEVRTDTLQLAAMADSIPPGYATFRIESERKLSPRLLTRTLQFRPGQWYSQSSVLATKRRLEGTGIFLFTDIVPLQSDTVRKAPGRPPRLPHRIELRTRRRHQIRLETFMLQRTGVLGTSQNELGTGAGISYENVNLLGRGESFLIRTTGSISADIESGLFTSAQGEIVASLTYPYLVGPFRRLESAFNLYDARTRLSLSLLTARRDEIGLIIRGRGNARYRLEMRHAPTVTSLVDLFEVSLSNPDTLTNFRENILEALAHVTDPVQQAQILEDYTVPQINTALRYTLRSANVNPLRRDRGYSNELSAEVGSNLPYLLDRYVYSPGTVEGSLPGIPIFTERGTPSRLIYRQYVRFVADARRYRPISSESVLAFKLIGGFAHPTGQSNILPFDRRFYSGGASSVRGWGLRELGPGSARFSAARDSADIGGEVTNVLGGDIKLEAGVELRNTFLRSILAADWIGVLFVDGGNVWFGPRNPGFGEDSTRSSDGRFHLDSFYREIGVGSGIGLRVAWEYLILRLDLGVKVYDPTRTGLLPDGLRRAQPHFGIGHAF